MKSDNGKYFTNPLYKVRDHVMQHRWAIQYFTVIIHIFKLQTKDWYHRECHFPKTSESELCKKLKLA